MIQEYGDRYRFTSSRVLPTWITPQAAPLLVVSCLSSYLASKFATLFLFAWLNLTPEPAERSDRQLDSEDETHMFSNLRWPHIEWVKTTSGLECLRTAAQLVLGFNSYKF